MWMMPSHICRVFPQPEQAVLSHLTAEWLGICFIVAIHSKSGAQLWCVLRQHSSDLAALRSSSPQIPPQVRLYVLWESVAMLHALCACHQIKLVSNNGWWRTWASEICACCTHWCIHYAECRAFTKECTTHGMCSPLSCEGPDELASFPYWWHEFVPYVYKFNMFSLRQSAK